jgi:phosphatidylethanolamine/phosphatidyl-N-methylethanolamine N-methyltransferase
MLVFMKQLLRDFRNTGALLPSSPRLAQAMTRSIRRRSRGPMRVLEVGPGTGPITRELLKAMRSGDELHVVEINPSFSRRLEERLLAPFRAARPDVRVVLHCCPIEAAPLEGRFDSIVCSLPFNNFPPPLVRRIFRQLLELLAEGGELVYFEYAGVRVLKGSVVGVEGRRKLKRIGATAKALNRRHAGRRELVLSNMPPAVAVRLSR